MRNPSSQASVPDGYPATDLIKLLFQIIDVDFASTYRNVHSSKSFVNRAKSVYNSINNLIYKVENGKELDFASFDAYSGAISPLEALLFDFTFLHELQSISLAPGLDSIEACRYSIENWKSDRAAIQSAISRFGESPFKDLLDGSPAFERTVTDARRHDDQTFFADMCKRIAVHKLGDTDITQGDKERLKDNATTQLSSIHTFLETKLVEDESMALVVQCSILIYGIMEVSINPKTTEDESYHLKSGKIWREINNLLQIINDCLRNKSSFSDEIKSAYNNLLQLLGETSADIAAIMLELIRIAGRVKRPYFYQSIALITGCRELSMYYTRNKTNGNRRVLEITVNETTSALQEATQIALDVKTFEINGGNIELVTKAYVNAKDKIKSCYKAYKLSNEWTAQENRMVDYLNRDREAMEVLRKKIGRPPVNANKPPMSPPSSPPPVSGKSGARSSTDGRRG